MAAPPPTYRDVLTEVARLWEEDIATLAQEESSPTNEEKAFLIAIRALSNEDCALQRFQSVEDLDIILSMVQRRTARVYNGTDDEPLSDPMRKIVREYLRLGHD
ncbi:MAG: hypothetical protein JKP92_07025 [Alphaproteobacteria bacterium]|jgi:hypothetical protein|nr:hypothetical protein [Alphaproteobacteria bacterium]